MSSQPLGTKKPFFQSALGRYGGTATAGLFALSHATQAINTLKTGDLVGTVMNVGLAGGAGYVAFQLGAGNSASLGAGLEKANSQLLFNLSKAGIEESDGTVRFLKGTAKSFIRTAF